MTTGGGLRPRSAIAGIFVLLLVCAMGAGGIRAEEADRYAHPAISVGAESFTAAPQPEPRDLGEISDYCLACHGPETASRAAAGATEAPRPAHPVGSAERSHPVDVAYPESASDYTPIEELDDRLLLIRGRLSCLTCHDREDPDHALVLPGAGSQICVACHRS